ncbi:MAG: STAS domain-containing protein [Acidimicrobiales bacterium]
MDELDVDKVNLTVEASTVEGVPMLTLVGELDISTADILRRAVDQVLGGRPERLLFDLRDLAFMDSSGIAVMIVAANGVEVVEFRHASPIIRRVVEATGLTDTLRLDPS